MARIPAFNRENARDAALKLFWSRGYTATSLPDLLDAMGIARSSFYAAFGDKRSLFIECLELFGDRTRDILLEGARDDDSLAAIHQFFHKTISEVPLSRLSCGCMMVNSILELSDVDAELQNLAREKLDAIETEFARLLSESQTQGKIAQQPTAAEFARAVMNLNLGVRVQSRKHPDPITLQHTVDTSLTLMGLAA